MSCLLWSQIGDGLNQQNTNGHASSNGNRTEPASISPNSDVKVSQHLQQVFHSLLMDPATALLLGNFILIICNLLVLICTQDLMLTFKSKIIGYFNVFLFN